MTDKTYCPDGNFHKWQTHALWGKAFVSNAGQYECPVCVRICSDCGRVEQRDAGDDRWRPWLEEPVVRQGIPDYKLGVDCWQALNDLLRGCTWEAAHDDSVELAPPRTGEYVVVRRDGGDIAQLLDAAEKAHSAFVHSQEAT